jgi:hypothetical protein
MIKKFLQEYNEEFDEVINPNQMLESDQSLTLCYRTITDYEIFEIEKFCKIYNLRFEVSTSHNEIFYIVKHG